MLQLQIDEGSMTEMIQIQGIDYKKRITKKLPVQVCVRSCRSSLLTIKTKRRLSSGTAGAGTPPGGGETVQFDGISDVINIYLLDRNPLYLLRHDHIAEPTS